MKVGTRTNRLVANKRFNMANKIYNEMDDNDI